MMTRKQLVTTLTLACCVCVSAPTAKSAPPGTPEADFVHIEARLEPATQSSNYTPPDGKILVVTDIVIQNKSPGDEPVLEDRFSRIAVNLDPDDKMLTVVGNQTLNLHFTTGIRVKGPFFRILNVTNSNAPFADISVIGYLAKRPQGF